MRKLDALKVLLLFIYLRCCINGVDWWPEPLESSFFLRVLLLLFLLLLIQHNRIAKATASNARKPDTSPQWTNFLLPEVLSSGSGSGGSVVEASVQSIQSIVLLLGTLGVLVISVWPAVPDADRSVVWISGASNDRMFWICIVITDCLIYYTYQLLLLIVTLS